MTQPQNASTLHRLDITVGEEDYEGLAGLLALKLSYGWEERNLPNGDTVFRVHCENPVLAEDVATSVHALFPEAAVERETVVVEDWVDSWKEFFTPVPCGTNFVVLPPWLVDDEAAKGRRKIVIEPKSAFGTGHHATTALCLSALSDLVDEGRIRAGERFLDLGTGSGVLGIGLCLCGLCGEGLDIDPVAVDNALENREVNGLAPETFSVALGSVDAVKDGPFDVVVANILARPLMDMAPDIVPLKKEGGVLVLSGILANQADHVAAAYQAQGLPAPKRRDEGEWACLVWS